MAAKYPVRVQVLLTPDEGEALRNQSHVERKSKSEILRAAWLSKNPMFYLKGGRKRRTA